MSIKLVVGSEIFNVVSVFAPQIGLDEDMKRFFWDDLEEVIQSILQTQKLLIGVDFNRHIGRRGMIMRRFMEALATVRETVEGCLFYTLRLHMN